MNKPLLVISMLVLVAATPAVVQAADDEIPDNCDYTPYSIEELEDKYDANATAVGGAINSPEDTDALPIQAEKGDYFAVTIFHEDIGDAERRLTFDLSPDTSATELENMEEYRTDADYYKRSDPTENASFKIYAEEDGPICLRMFENGGFQSEYNWSFTISQNNENRWYPAPDGSMPTATPSPTPTETPVSTPTPTATDTGTVSNTNGGTEEDDIQDSDGDGVIDSEDYAPNDPDVQEKSDLEDTTTSGSGPGFGLGLTVTALLLIAVAATRRP
jgi:PGF-CTERM protein